MSFYLHLGFKGKRVFAFIFVIYFIFRRGLCHEVAFLNYLKRFQKNVSYSSRVDWQYCITNRFLIKVHRWVTIKMMQIFSPTPAPGEATEGRFPCLVWRGHECGKALSPDLGSERGLLRRSSSSVWKDPSWLPHLWDAHPSLLVFSSSQGLLSKQPAAHPRDVRADEAQ